MSQNYHLKMFFYTFMDMYDAMASCSVRYGAVLITMIRLIPLQGLEIVSKCAGEGLVDVFQNRPL